jgi:hypothetical protein
MSDETTTPTDDALEHAPVEDYGGDDTARGTVYQPGDHAPAGREGETPARADDDAAAGDVVTDATVLPDDPSLGG